MPSALVAVIPYTTHPTIELGPITLRTFGLMVAIGVLLGAWFAAVHGEKYGLPRDDTYRLGTRMVLAGVVGARITWVLTNLDQIDEPLDVIAVWEGGLQFAGGFIAAIAMGIPTFLRWNRLQRWQLLDGFAVATVIGAAIGRIGCLSVGEHFGRRSDFLLATRYDGGGVREPTLGLDPDAPTVSAGTSFHNLSLYEFMSLVVMFFFLWWLLRRRLTPSIVGGIFLLAYAVSRFSLDILRVNDERVAGLTGAQLMSVAMVPIGIYVLTRVRPAMAASLAAGEVGGTPVTHGSGPPPPPTKRRAGERRLPSLRSRSTPTAAAPSTEDGSEDGPILVTDDDGPTNEEDPEPSARDATDGAPPSRRSNAEDRTD